MKSVLGFREVLHNKAPLLLLTALWRERRAWLAVLALTFFYGLIISTIRGDGEWIYVDEVGRNNFYWGDDAYRWFIARSAWLNPDVYWFNFSLPVWIFLEGLIATLSQDILLHARYLKAALTAISVILFYKACLKLGFLRWTSVAGAFLLASMPLYFFVGMSFYGESWLAFLITASLYCHVHGYRRSFLLIMAMMPLVRPEGFFFVVAFTAILLFQRRWRELPVMLSFGGIFFISIFVFSEPSAFFGWRAEAAKAYQAQGEVYGWDGRSLFDVFAVPLALPALIGLLLPKVRPLFGFYVGALFVFLKWGVDFSANKALFESRYFSPLIPLVVLAFVGSLDAAYLFFKKEDFFIREVRFLLALLVVLVFGSHIYSLTTIRTAFLWGVRDGQPLRYLSTNWSEGGRLYGLSLEEKAYYREYANVVTKMLMLNQDIKVLLVGNVQAFYFLDPKLIPDHVRVVFSLFSRVHQNAAFASTEAAGYFAEQPYYGYFSLTDPTYEKDKLLYMDYVPDATNPYQWQVGGSKMAGPNSIYLFGTHFRGMKHGKTGSSK